jgi:hypothetical protein
MGDTREFAKVDVGWHLNAKWYTVERVLRRLMPDAMPDALLLAHADARCMHLVSILHCSQQRSDGIFPVAAVKVLARASSEEAVTALFEVGMWINHTGGMAEVRDFLEHQPSSQDRDQATTKAKRAAAARWSKDASSNASSTASSNAPRNAQESRGEKSRNTAPRSATTTVPDGFDDFWANYPKKVDKGHARKAYATALTKTDATTLATAASAYAAHLTATKAERRFTANPGTWLNGERWTDDLTDATATPEPKSPWGRTYTREPDDA